MIRILLSLVLGILPQSLYFMLFVTNIKQIKTRRLILLLLLFILCILLNIIIRYNIYLYLAFIPLYYFTLKLLYKKKAQIIDIFIISLSFAIMSIISYVCSLIYKNNYNLYWIAYIINNVLLFSVLIFNKIYVKLYRKYIQYWNRRPENKIRSISIRNISLILLNVFILILDIIIINNL